MVPNDVIEQSAREVVDRLGSSAIDYMHNCVATNEKGGTPQESDQAWRRLTEIERIFGGEEVS